MASVYGLIRQSDSTVRYVGMTSKSVQERFEIHLRSSRRNRPLPVYDWMRKHADVTFVILHENLSVEEALRLEIVEISRRTNLLNLTKGGDGTFGYKHTQITRQRLSEVQKGKVLPEEQKAKMSASHTGKKRTASERAAIGAGRRGAKHSPESIQKISEAAKNRTPEQKAKYAEAARNRKLVTCPYCKKVTQPNNAKRWHFEKCKSKKTS
jgi:hypothetical protein